MKIIDKYILGKFLRTFFFTVLLSTAVSVVFDFSEKVQKLTDTHLPAGTIIREYFIPFILFIDSTIWPIFILISVIFFTSRLAKNSEILSMFNAGISFRRVLYPYIIGGLIVSGIHLVANHFLIPYGEKSRIVFIADYLSDNKRKIRESNIQQMLTPNSMIYIRTYRASDTTAYDIQLNRIENDKIVEIIKANRMEMVEPPFEWKLYDYSIRSFEEDQQLLEVHKNKYLDTTLFIQPSDFIQIEEFERTFTTLELYEKVQEQKLKGFSNVTTSWIEIHRRTADAVTSFILAILAVSISSRKVRGGLGLHLAAGLLIGALFILFSKFSITFASSAMVPPALGVWLPNIVFGALTFVMYKMAQR
ncbi:MAG TPA: LptF/LptG family permease [Membranihabitans sp.]|nr:LptF/LptG family permease [Membranihabitans sp.]